MGEVLTRQLGERASKEFNECFDMCSLCAFSLSTALGKSFGDAATVQHHFELRLASVEPRGDSLYTPVKVSKNGLHEASQCTHDHHVEYDHDKTLHKNNSINSRVNTERRGWRTSTQFVFESAVT